MAAKEADLWAGQELRARRKKAKLTQAQLAEKADIERSVYNALENGRREITATYAARLAKHVGLKDYRKLLPPQEQPVLDPENPLSRLAAAEAEVAFLQEWVARAFESLGVSPELQDEARRAVSANGG